VLYREYELSKLDGTYAKMSEALRTVRQQDIPEDKDLTMTILRPECRADYLAPILAEDSGYKEELQTLLQQVYKA